MSNLAVIFSTASGLSFMKAENKDSKRKEKMYIMINYCAFIHWSLSETCFGRKPKNFLWIYKIKKKKDIDIYI